MLAVSLETIYEHVSSSELGEEWITDPLMQQDVWSLAAMGCSAEERQISGRQNVNFNRISLPWLNLLAKLTVKARVREGYSLINTVQVAQCLSHLNQFLVDRGYIQPVLITDNLLQIFVTERHSSTRNSILAYATRLWTEEGWLSLPFTPLRHEQRTPKVEIIPEEVLHQVYEHLDLFPAPLERAFRLQIALGCRLNEIQWMPRYCLKQENEQWFLLRWVAKLKQFRYECVHPLIAELVKEQQQFLDEQFGIDSKFDKLFCQISTAIKDGATPGGKFKCEPVYQPSCLSNVVVGYWLRAFSEEANLRDKQGNRFQLTSHMFRRTKASIMAHCEAEDEYIAAVLGHSSLDILVHYRKRSLERLERDAKAKGYVDMYGKVTTHKPRKQRYEKLAELMKVSTPLGECHRPLMLGDCKARYACLSCEHHRITEADRPHLEADRDRLQYDLEKALAVGQQRRVTEIERLLELVNNRLEGLEKLAILIEESHQYE